jgi:hypothetical protein
MQKINDTVEKLFHKKAVIKSVFILPLITIVIIAISINNFYIANRTVPYINEAKHLFVGILALLCINAVANFASLILYYCLHNRIEHLSKKYRKKL